MWYDGYAPTLLYGGGDGDGTGPAAHALPFYQSAFHFVIDVFSTVGGDVDMARLEGCECLDGFEQGFRAGSLQWREDFEGETSGCTSISFRMVVC